MMFADPGLIKYRVGCTALSLLLLFGQMLLSGCCSSSTEETESYQKISDRVFPEPQIEFAPEKYVCYRAAQSIRIDGRLDDDSWQKAPWTDSFIDIEGKHKPAPRFETRAKMLWDDNYFYIAGDMEEPDVWGTLTQRDAIIFHDNDFEVFIDPDGDTHEYYELEVNALGTEWDLFLVKPYRDGGPAVDAWDIQGLKTAVYIDGTVNRPGDIDKGWSIEIAIPWDVLRQCAHKPAPPEDGDQWRVNFSRVEWKAETTDGQYVKKTDSETGKVLPEDNWVWSPQGLINMHYPEMWGYVQFYETAVGDSIEPFVSRPEEKAKWALRRLYYKQQTHRFQYGRYTDNLDRLDIGPVQIGQFLGPPKITVASEMFEAYIEKADDDSRLYISQDGRIWSGTGKW